MSYNDSNVIQQTTSTVSMYTGPTTESKKFITHQHEAPTRCQTNTNLYIMHSAADILRSSATFERLITNY